MLTDKTHVMRNTEIYLLYVSGEFTYKEISEIYGVSSSRIAQIVPRIDRMLECVCDGDDSQYIKRWMDTYKELVYMLTADFKQPSFEDRLLELVKGCSLPLLEIIGALEMMKISLASGALAGRKKYETQ